MEASVPSEFSPFKPLWSVFDHYFQDRLALMIYTSRMSNTYILYESINILKS